jgi:hypothetical protein
MISCLPLMQPLGFEPLTCFLTCWTAQPVRSTHQGPLPWLLPCYGNDVAGVCLVLREPPTGTKQSTHAFDCGSSATDRHTGSKLRGDHMSPMCRHPSFRTLPSHPHRKPKQARDTTAIRLGRSKPLTICTDKPSRAPVLVHRMQQ